MLVCNTPKIFFTANPAALNKYSASRPVLCNQALSGNDCRRWESFSARFPPDEKVKWHFCQTHQTRRENTEVGRFFEVQRWHSKEIHDFWLRILRVSWFRHFVMQLPLPNLQTYSAQNTKPSRNIWMHYISMDSEDVSTLLYPINIKILHSRIPLIWNYTCQHVDTKTVFLWQHTMCFVIKNRFEFLRKLILKCTPNFKHEFNKKMNQVQAIWIRN